MFLSIVIPIWNDEKYLNECMDSCLDQNLSKDEYEIICVDDGSTDRTPDILREYAEKYPNIRVIAKEHTGGGGRNVGLDAARADFVWFVDHDDLVAPGAADRLKKTAEQHPDRSRISFPYYMFYDEFNEAEKALFSSNELHANDGGGLTDQVVWSAIYSRSFLIAHEIRPLSTRIQEAQNFWQLEPFRTWAVDTIFVEECLDKGINTLALDGPPLYYYRRNDNSESLAASPEMMEKRALLRRNLVLVWGFLIDQLEQKCVSERKDLGLAKPETVEKLIYRFRRCSIYMNNLPFRQWATVVRLFSKKKLFLKRKPAEYRITFRSYRKKLWGKEKYVPHILAGYYTYTKAGAMWYRLLSWPMRRKERNPRVAARRLKERKEKMLAIGTGSDGTESHA